MKKVLKLLGETFAKRYAEEHSIKVSSLGGSAETNYRRWKFYFTLIDAIKIFVAIFASLLVAFIRHKEDHVIGHLALVSGIALFLLVITWTMLMAYWVYVKSEKSKKLYHGWSWRREVLMRVEGLRSLKNPSKGEIQKVIESRLKKLSSDLGNVSEQYGFNSPHWKIIEEIRELKQISVECELQVSSLITLLGPYHNAKRKPRVVK